MKENSNQQNEIDLLALVKKLLLSKYKILKFIFIFSIFGLLSSFLMEKTYTSSIEFISLSGNDSKGSIGGFASLAGISLGGDMLSSSELSPIQYPEIINSSKFRKEILNTTISYEGQSLTYKNIVLTKKPKRILPLIIKYTIGLPGQIMKLFIKNNLNASNVVDSSILNLTYEDKQLVDGLENVITMGIDQKDGSINITCNFIDPLGTAQLTQKVFQLLQKEVIELKLKQSQYTLNRTKTVLNEKGHLLFVTQNNLASFKDKNNFINTSSFQNQLIRLQSENDNANAVYQQVASQVEQAKLDITKNTPIFSVLHPIEVPLMKTAPKRLLITYIFGFLGFIVASSIVLFSESFTHILNKINE